MTWAAQVSQNRGIMREISQRMNREEPMTSTIIPTRRYRNARKMIDWLAFGFERHAIYGDDVEGIAHAQLTLGTGMIMVGSARDDEFGRLQAARRRRSRSETEGDPPP
jgi:hypothetical protein